MTESSNKRMTAWQFVMLALCTYVLVALFVSVGFTLPAEEQRLLDLIDTFVCVVFLIDFAVQLLTAKSKLGYLKWGWIDLISSIPNLQVFRIGRAMRIFRLLRLLRGVKSLRVLIQFLFENRAKGVFASAVLICFVLMVAASIVVLNVEQAAGGNIKTAPDALWWAFTTMTTVGYGELYPITMIGRLAAAMLMTAGVGLFGTVTAFMATKFVETGQQEELARDDQILTELREIRRRLDGMEKK
jgi:voltage-gated potassium channel